MASSAAGAAGPKVRVASVQGVFHNGEHNAFTDLIRFNGKFYLTFRSCPDGHMVHPTASIIILASDETAFLFEADGRILGIGRRGRGPEQLLRSQPPYKEWERKDLDRYVGGPLVTKWGRHVLVGGRKITPETGSKTSLCWLVGDQLHEFAELPSGGDNSYPGFVALGPDRALVSYYSSHERDGAGNAITAIYLAELVMER